MASGPDLSTGPRLTYLLPIRGTETGEELEELTAYLRWLADRTAVLIVDGSDPELFAAHAERWSGFATHIVPQLQDRCLNGKAWGVRTGLRCATGPFVIIADDDVRYDEEGLEAVRRALADGADVVRPQNYFDPLPWHAAWDTARSLLNRAVSVDHPGTLGIDREAYLRMGGYDGNVLFENLQLVRSIAASGGRVADRPDLFVRRSPPSARKFLGQRVRQAYDDLAQPIHLVFALAVLPSLGWILAERDPAIIGVASVLLIVLAEAGRRRNAFASVVPTRCSLLAPFWVLERGMCSWIALASRLVLGGCPYAGWVIRRAADPMRRLRRQALQDDALRHHDDSRHTAEQASIDRIGRARPRRGRRTTGAAPRPAAP